MSNENLALGLFLLLPFVCGGALWLLYRASRRRSIAAGWPRLVLGNGLLLALLLSGGLLGGEVYFRFCYDTTDALAYTKVSRRWLERHWHTNPAGVRDDLNYSLRRTSGRRRVTFLGDSFTAGHGVKRVGDRFVNLVRQRHPEWEVHCLAELGMDTGDEIRYLGECTAKGYELEDVVLVYCLNDVADLMPEWAAIRARIFAGRDEPGWFKDNSYFLNLVYYRYRAMRNPEMRNYFQFVRETDRGPVWEQQQARLRELKQLIEARGGRLLVVTFPFLHQLGPGYEFQSVHGSLNEFWRAERVPHLDLLDTFRPNPSASLTVNSFDAHPNEYAHQLAAAEIERFLANPSP